MTRAVWPEPEAVEALQEVVPLAVHRYRQDRQDPKAHPPSDWAIRLNVMAYPQFRFLDGEGRALPVTTDVVRTPGGLRRAIRRARAAYEGSKRGDRYLGRLDASAFERAKSHRERVRAFELADPLAQLAILDRRKPDLADDATRISIQHALQGPNDWVRIRAIELLGRCRGEAAGRLLAKQIDRLLSGRHRYANPNNVLMAAMRAAKTLADRALVPSLARVLETRSGNNMATLYAVEALIAVSQTAGFEAVAQVLERADEIEGRLAPRIRRLIAAARAAAKR